MSLPHQNLVAWQRADDLFIDVHRLTHQRFPRFERFELGQQVRRAAWSVPANIVEGIARGRGLDSIRFFKIARGSLSELGYGLHASRRLGYITEEELAIYQQRLSAIGGPLKGLIKKRRLELGVKSIGSAVIAVLIMTATVL
ncbi:MAG TPA: four helix bundle protein [Vicinamibacterales bacterium]|nr:four helix bundle protein [Vicinamibacterales bacterium]